MAAHRGAAPARNRQQPANVVFLFRRNQQLCLDAGRALMLCGALVVTTIPTGFGFVPANADSPAAAAANPTTLIAFVGFLFWILGASLCLLALTPAAPWAVRAGSAMASAVLKCLCPPVGPWP